jgi:uncharacterized protein YdaU (DUF1376 family)
MPNKEEVTWIKLVPSKFISDVELQLMTAAERGVAFWLWMLLYCNKGKLKCKSNALASANDFDAKTIAMMCNSTEDDVRSVVSSKFQIKNGFIVSKKVDEVLSDSQARIGKGVKAAKERWNRQSKGNNQADAQGMLPHIPSNAITNKQTNKHNKENKKEKLSTFDEARIIYPGTKRGLETEFNYFTKVHKNWQEILPLLKPAIEKQITQRQQLKSQGVFVPEWKHLKSWIYNRYWELNFGEAEGKSESPSLSELTHPATAEEIERLEAEGIL